MNVSEICECDCVRNVNVNVNVEASERLNVGVVLSVKAVVKNVMRM